MGWYANKVLPIGAIYVGFAASSGYGIASWFAGVKISGRVLAAVFALQVAAYFAASWLQFAAYAPVYEDGTRVSFLTYFDVTTRAFAFVQRDGTAGEAFGAWGYGMRALEIAGFCLGSLLAPAALKGRAYCDSCSLYMRGAKTFWLAASLPKAAQADSARQATAYQTAIIALDELAALAEANDSAGFRARLKELEVGGGDAKKLPHRIALTLMRCPSCESGELHSFLWSGGLTQSQSRALGRAPLAKFFARDAAS